MKVLLLLSLVAPVGRAQAPGQFSSIPITNGLMAEYRILPGETAASLIDWSGNGRNATGTTGTPPTVLANTGGLNCGGAGAITLPSTLNSALTIMAYMSFQQPTGISQQYNGPIVASGFANSGSVAFLLNQLNGTSGNYPIGGSSYFETFDGNTGSQRTYAKMAWNGTGSWAVTMGASNNNIYINGVLAPLFGSGTSAGLMSGQVYQICGNNFPSWFNGQIYYALFYNRVLTAAEVAQNANYLATVMAARGVTQTLTPSDSNSQIVADGDSITIGLGLPTNTPWPEALTIGGNAVQTQNIAQSGATCIGAKNAFPLQVVPLYRSTAERNLYALWCGTNDVQAAGGYTAAQTWGNLRQILHSAKLTGYKVLVSTMISRIGTGTGGATNDSLKNQLNALIRQNWGGEADGLVDIASFAQLGADGANSNLTYFQNDAVHPTQNSVYNIEAAAYNRTIGRLYGPQDFSAAPVFASALSTATPTVGASSGNTVTLTFASNPYAVGEYITCSNQVPSGYASPTGLGWLVLTADATHITYWTPGTNLGALTTFGTCQPASLEEQPASGVPQWSKYWVVNYSGTVNVPDCQGYTGQNLYIRDINASNGTLQGFGSETITGAGATPTTLTANTTAVLQSQLVSASAGGCNWVRLQ
jgi:trimeric autotransporter adhesin